MNMQETPERDLYYTREHEWIEFLGAVAYVGVCESKLFGVKQIHQIIVVQPIRFKKRGDIVAAIQYADYRADVFMPVDGKILLLNEALAGIDLNLMLNNPETFGWVALIIPSQPIDRSNLLGPLDYHGMG